MEGQKKENKIFCNKCGKEIKVENEIPKEDYISVTKPWGYFSKKDGKTYHFVLCEECSDALMADFAVPAEVSETLELLF